MVKSPPPPTFNNLFASMPADAQKRLMPELKLVSLPLDKILHSPNESFSHLYFPIDAIVALTHLIDDGSSSKISIIGNEGLVGAFLFLSDESTSTQAMILCSGYAYSVPKRLMLEEFNRHGSSFILMLRYIQTLFAQTSQTAVCNRHHTIEQQFCRLLLQVLDRVPCNNLVMTHDLIAKMLGVRRGGISEVAGRLQKLEIITYHRGHITVLQRKRLEEMSCECYACVKMETNRLIPMQLDARKNGSLPTCDSENCPICAKSNQNGQFNKNIKFVKTTTAATKKIQPI